MLHSFSFGTISGYSELPDEVLNLFSSLVVNPEKKIEFAGEIISAGLEGRIDFSSEFNLDAYEATIRKNNKLNLNNKRKYEVFLDFGSNSDEDSEVFRQGGVKEDFASSHTVDQIKDAYEQILLDAELEYAINTIKELQPVLAVEERIDFIGAIRLALKGIPDAISKIKRICDEYDVVAEQVKVILGSGKTFDEMFAF